MLLWFRRNRRDVAAWIGGVVDMYNVIYWYVFVGFLPWVRGVVVVVSLSWSYGPVSSLRWIRVLVGLGSCNCRSGLIELLLLIRGSVAMDSRKLVLWVRSWQISASCGAQVRVLSNVRAILQRRSASDAATREKYLIVTGAKNFAIR